MRTADRPLQASLAFLALFRSPASASGAPDCSRAGFEAILASAGATDATVEHASQVAEGGSFGIPSLAFPQNATDLPAACAVSVRVRSSPDSSFGFGMFLPETATWNERLMASGNGGYGGGINWPDMGRMVHYGFATVSTDTGHNSSSDDNTWALNAPESINDWGYRAMHGSVALAKSIAAAYYGCDIKFSYYASCSTGGRQGLKEIQLHPDSFDGIVVGAPAWWSPHLAAASLKMPLDNWPEDAPGYIGESLFSVIEAEMVRQCDAQDGVEDEIVNDAFGCTFDYEALLCSDDDAAADDCLTPEQVETIKKTYSDWVDEPTGDFVFSGLAPATDPSFMLSEPTRFGYGLFQYMVYNDTEWDWAGLEYAHVQEADAINPGSATADGFGALAEYRARGGKVIMYHGAADSLIPTGSSVDFYAKTREALVGGIEGEQKEGEDLDAFFRFFLVPGMGHCSGSSSAPWYVSAGSQEIKGTTHSVPGFEDPDHDVILAVMRWVEEGVAPDQLIATKFQDDDASAEVLVQRPLCPYPLLATYVGSGDVNAAENWVCKKGAKSQV